MLYIGKGGDFFDEEEDLDALLQEMGGAAAGEAPPAPAAASALAEDHDEDAGGSTVCLDMDMPNQVFVTLVDCTGLEWAKT